MRLVSFIFLVASGLVYSLFFAATPVSAAIRSCEAIASESNLSVDDSAQVGFTVYNYDASTSISWAKITAPSTGFTIDSSTTWTSDIATSSATFTGSAIAAGESEYFRLNISTGSDAVAPAAWTVQVSDDAGGANPVTCMGIVYIGIVTEQTDVSSPGISSVAVSDVTSSSVKISWTTDEAATTYIQYGKTLRYETFSHNTTLTTSHSVELTGLSANTTYYYLVKSANASWGVGEWNDSTFSTAKVVASTSTTTTTTTTTSTTSTSTSSTASTSSTTLAPVDTTAPTVTVKADFSKPFRDPPAIGGRVSDNSEVKSAEYSVDGGNNWLPVKLWGSATSKTFTFTPTGLEDGNYSVVFRVKDATGNITLKDLGTLIIDKIAPQVGGNITAIGPQILLPDSNGVLTILSGQDETITVSATGGPVSIDLAIEPQVLGTQTSSDGLDVEKVAHRTQEDDMVFALRKSVESGLWSGKMRFSAPGMYRVLVRAIDGAGNKTERVLQSVFVVGNGMIKTQDGGPVAGAKVSVYVQNKQGGAWKLWSGSSFGQQNPQTTDEKGFYSLFLPAGRYYLQVEANGYIQATSSIFTLTTSSPVTASFVLTPRKEISLGSLRIPGFNFQWKTQPVVLSVPPPPTVKASSLVGKEAPFFSLPDTSGETFSSFSLRGKPSVVTFVTIWSPTSLEQITLLNELYQKKKLNAVVVLSQHTLSQSRIFRKRGAYTIPLIVDQDGVLVKDYALNSLPLHYFFDRKGVVTDVVTGVLNSEEIEKRMSI